MIAALTAGFAAAALAAGLSSTPLPPPGGQVAVVSFGAAGSVSFDGASAGSIGWGQATPETRLSSGPHAVIVAGTTGNVALGPGCTVLVVVAHPNGPSLPATFTSHSECPIPRAPDGDASIRFAPAIAQQSAPGGVTFTIDGINVDPVNIGNASPRIDVPAGADLPWTIAIGGRTIRSGAQTLTAGTAETAVFGGGGEQPAAIVWVTDGTQTKAAPPTGAIFNTGVESSTSGHGTLPAVAGGLILALAATLGGLARFSCWRSRRVREPIVTSPQHWRASTGVATVIVLALAGCGTKLASTSPTSSPATPVPATIHQAPTVTLPVSPTGVPTMMSSRVASGQIVPVSPGQISQLPTLLRDPDIAWIRGSGPPGSGEGNTVLAGHVVWGARLGVFGQLQDLQVGDIITVTTDDHRAHTYRVEGGIVLPKITPWAAAWAPTGTATLTLVTCTGPIGSDGLHTENLWITATAT